MLSSHDSGGPVESPSWNSGDALKLHFQHIFNYPEQLNNPYSPDYNPIEELFSKLKATIKQYELNLEMEEMDLHELFWLFFQLSPMKTVAAGSVMLEFIQCSYKMIIMIIIRLTI